MSTVFVGLCKPSLDVQVHVEMARKCATSLQYSLCAREQRPLAQVTEQAPYTGHKAQPSGPSPPPSVVQHRSLYGVVLLDSVDSLEIVGVVVICEIEPSGATAAPVSVTLELICSLLNSYDHCTSTSTVVTYSCVFPPFSGPRASSFTVQTPLRPLVPLVLPAHGLALGTTSHYFLPQQMHGSPLCHDLMPMPCSMCGGT